MKEFLIVFGSVGSFLILLAFIMSSSSSANQKREPCQTTCLDKHCANRIINCKDGTRWYFSRGHITPLAHPCDEELENEIIIINE